MDQYQRLFRSDGKWMKRKRYPLNIPIRDQLEDAYQTVYFKKNLEDEVNIENISTIGENFFSNQIPRSSKFGAICEYIGMLVIIFN